MPHCKSSFASISDFAPPSSPLFKFQPWRLAWPAGLTLRQFPILKAYLRVRLMNVRSSSFQIQANHELFASKSDSQLLCFFVFKFTLTPEEERPADPTLDCYIPFFQNSRLSPKFACKFDSSLFYLLLSKFTLNLNACLHIRLLPFFIPFSSHSDLSRWLVCRSHVWLFYDPLLSKIRLTQKPEGSPANSTRCLFPFINFNPEIVLACPPFCCPPRFSNPDIIPLWLTRA